ncbi:hypothetical protein [Streptomyces virginiae]
MLTARFTAPAVPKTLVHRPELLRRLTAGVRGPLTLINGPAGSGKTVLTAHWAAAGGRAPRAPLWLTVEPDDAPGVFWAYVLEALHRGGVELPAAVGRPTRAEGVTQSFLVRLAAGLAESAQPVVLVLDQFDTAQPPAMTEGLDFVLRHAAGGLRIVLTSRTDSLLPLHRYRAAGEIAEIRHADLRFTHADAEALLGEHRLDISQAGIRLLMRRTEGWAAGVRLCALAMQRSPDPEAFVRQFAADRTTIADYLLREVLDAQPPDTQDLLLRVSVTDRVHPDLADALTGRDDAARTLAGLARDNAFLEQVDASAWYRLHPLFAEVLRAHLRQRHPGLEQQLHGRAARWLAGTGRLTEAVVQGAAAGDWPFAAGQLVDDLAIGRLFTGLEAEQLNRAFAPLPAEAPGAAPALVGAAARLVVQDLPGYEDAARRADSRLSPGSGAAARFSRAFLGVLAGRATGDPAATERAAADAERVLGELPPQRVAAHPELRALLLAALGAVRLGAGRPDAAQSALTAAVEACAGPGTDPGTQYPLCDALGSLALAELMRGRLRQAAEHARASLAVAEHLRTISSRTGCPSAARTPTSSRPRLRPCPRGRWTNWPSPNRPRTWRAVTPQRPSGYWTPRPAGGPSTSWPVPAPFWRPVAPGPPRGSWRACLRTRASPRRPGWRRACSGRGSPRRRATPRRPGAGRPRPRTSPGRRDCACACRRSPRAGPAYAGPCGRPRGRRRAGAVPPTAHRR